MRSEMGEPYTGSYVCKPEGLGSSEGPLGFLVPSLEGSSLQLSSEDLSPEDSSKDLRADRLNKRSLEAIVDTCNLYEKNENGIS